MLINLIDQNHIEIEGDTECERFDIKTIGYILKGTKTGSFSDKRHFYNDIVNNEYTGIDCCLYDKLLRDTHKLGFKPFFEPQILLNSSLIVEDEICFKKSDLETIISLFKAKYQMNQKFYNQRISQAIELMMTDFFLESDSVLKYEEKVGDVEKFMRFDDSVVDYKFNSSKSLEKSHRILLDIANRNLYCYVGKYSIIPKTNDTLCVNERMEAVKKFARFNEETLLNYLSEDDCNVQKGEIRIYKESEYFGIDEDSDNSFIEKIPFYDEKYGKVHFHKEDLSDLDPKNNQKKNIKIFLVNTTKDNNGLHKNIDKIKALQNALERYHKENSSSQQGLISLHKSPGKNVSEKPEINFQNYMKKNNIKF